MTRVKRGIISLKRRRNVLAQVKGYRFGRGTKERQAREAIAHAGSHAFAHRRDKKNDRRRLWQVRLNAAIRPMGMTYSKFINLLTVKKVSLDRKILSDIAHNNPQTFERIVGQIK
ncbi:50S ribosomal protein L20 [Candidatus Nomurabacteria bacterium RIFCSPHIGHO2_02_FULL_38_15]|uniref:Large ribosomal subunit protein bL20 n=1 Tax=Candidatus Nomurabacteria bacterium RIFCSPHIGHO2_02_FULL_38_15 TaxID=1801752 RepID=A0A1F6VQH1_9BACT|nr:MAG: 50S ribosomal protein L20 [Candidatus Nomurabacteria bacterium RIFCSPHIGHO2_02_FULL_38_15]